MTDRVRTFTVQLSRDMRTDDVEVVKNAVLMIKGVHSVENGDVVGLEERMRRTAALREFVTMQMEFLHLALGHDDDTFKKVKELLAASFNGRSAFD